MKKEDTLNKEQKTETKAKNLSAEQLYNKYIKNKKESEAVNV